MKKKLLIYIFLYSTLIYSQKDEIQILKVIFEEIKYNPDKEFLQCEKEKIFFLRKDYENEVNIPLNILDEFKKVAKEIDGKYLGKWCYPCKSQLKWRKKQKKALISISQPIFDTENNYCIVSVIITRKIGSASGMTYILKRVKNKWNIIEYLDLWIT